MGVSKKKIKELEKNPDFIRSVWMVADIIRKSNGVIPTPRELYSYPPIDMVGLAKKINLTDHDNRLWELLTVEAKKLLTDAKVRKDFKDLLQANKAAKEAEKKANSRASSKKKVKKVQQPTPVPLLREKHAQVVFRIERQLRQKK